MFSNPDTHWGSFFGNAIADWTGVVVMIDFWLLVSPCCLAPLKWRVQNDGILVYTPGRVPQRCR